MPEIETGEIVVSSTVTERSSSAGNDAAAPPADIASVRVDVTAPAAPANMEDSANSADLNGPSARADVAAPPASADFDVPNPPADIEVPVPATDIEVPNPPADVAAPASSADLDAPSARADVAAPATSPVSEAPAAHTDHAHAAPVAASAPARSALFGPPLLLPGEDPRNYEQLLASTYAAVKPEDFVDEIFVDAICYHTWEFLRLRRMKTALLASTAIEELAAIIRRFYSRLEKADVLVWQWARAEQAAVKQIDVLLAQVGLNVDAVKGRALARRIDEFERIDRIIVATEACRTATFHEIERHRATLAPRLRQAAQRIEDAEFTSVDERHPGAGENHQ